MDYNVTQNAFMVIERLAALVATPGIDDETKAVANAQIRVVLEKVIKPALASLSATSSGLRL